ncbi:tetratricopeptide repeat protein [Nonomuraea fuscirosea]|uniref:tetratricopeptide repeat protein n=1 Tax=Nonomuraea fuscirosea TaxID=1291556 RepID=UPI0033ED1C48
MTASNDRGEPPAVRLHGSADAHGRLYQAAGDQTLFQVTQHPPRRPLPQASTVQVPFGLAGLPRRPAATFVGREQALTELQRMLHNGRGTGMISQTVVGLGGVGKSELALQYAVRHRETYRLVWWVEADKLTQIQAGLAALTRELVAGVESAAAQQATPEEAAAWALAWLNTHTGWLLIFDNLEEIADIEPYLSRLAKGHLLITTRRDIDWRQRVGVNPLRLDLLPRTAALVALRERTVGQHHPDTLTTRANLARWTGEAGNAAAARDQYATLVVLRERVLGKDHPDTLTAQTGLARWMGKAGDAAAARDHYTALLPALQRVRGPDHPETLAARGNLAYSAGKAGDAVTARDQYAALLPAITRIQGAEHPDTLTIRHNLARWTGEAGDASTARDQLAELLPIRERLLGTRHPDTQSTQASLLHWTARAG